MKGPVESLLARFSAGLHQRPSIIMPPGRTTPSYAQHFLWFMSIEVPAFPSGSVEFGVDALEVTALEDDADEEEEEEVAVGFDVGYLMKVMRCQPGISCCVGRPCKMPEQWNGSVSYPVPVKAR